MLKCNFLFCLFIFVITVTIIGNTAFFSTLLTSITIPDIVTTTQDEAFSTNNITSVTLGSGVETIGVFAFADSFSLNSVTLPPAFNFLDIHAFNYTGMSEITFPEPEAGYISTWENGSGTLFYGGDSVPVNDSYTRDSYEYIFEYSVYDEFLKLITISA